MVTVRMEASMIVVKVSHENILYCNYLEIFYLFFYSKNTHSNNALTILLLEH